MERRGRGGGRGLRFTVGARALIFGVIEDIRDLKIMFIANHVDLQVWMRVIGDYSSLFANRLHQFFVFNRTNLASVSHQTARHVHLKLDHQVPRPDSTSRPCASAVNARTSGRQQQLSVRLSPPPPTPPCPHPSPSLHPAPPIHQARA